MRKSSSGRQRAGSEASSRYERPRNDDQDSPTGHFAPDATTSSRRKSSRHSYHEEPDATYATTITDEPSQISGRYRDDTRKESERNDTRRRSSKTERRTKHERSRGSKEDNESWKPKNEDSPRDSRQTRKSSERKDSARDYRHNSASLPQNQFPGEFPSTYSQPYRPPGLAAEYYGDQGESVASQPGVRPNAPNIVTSAEQAHLQEPTVEAKPPPEPSSMGQVGAAASYFGKPNYDSDIGSQTTPSKPHQKPSLGSNKPPKHSSYGASPRSSPGPPGTHAPPFGVAPGAVGSFPVSGTAAIGAAAEYYAGGGGGGGGGAGPSASAYQTPNRPPAGLHVTSTPYSAPAGFGVSHQHSNAGLYGGAAALAGAAAGAYVSGHSHNAPSLDQHQHSADMAGLAHDHSVSHGHQMHHAHRHKHQGLFGRFIDWWRDPEAVARFEEYTETIGVCKYCFDPRSSPADAPRRHDYRRRKPSPGSRYGSTTRVDKMYRHSSDENLRKSSSLKKKMVVGALTGYGVAKVGQAVVQHKHDFDDTYPVKSGRPVNQSRVSFQAEQPFPRDNDAGFQDPKRVGRSSVSSTQRRHRAGRSSSSSSSSSSHAVSRGGVLSAGMGAAGVAVGAAALGAESRRQRENRSRSPRSGRRYFSKRVSPMHSYVDLSTTNDGPGGLMGFFTSPSANSKKGKKPKGLFHFSNASSSSSDADLRFGEGTVRRKPSKRRLPERQGRQHRNNPVPPMEDLFNRGAALADEANRREHKGRQKYDANKYVDPGSRDAHGRRISMADHETTDGRDDEWYDTDGEVDSESSVDTAMAYGGGFSASQSREHLAQGGRASVSSYNFRKDDQRRHRNSLGQAKFGHAPSFPTSSIETATVAGAAGALGGWMASNALSQESNPPPTYSALDPMRELEPRPVSDPPPKAASPYATRVSSTSVPLQQPQPIPLIAPFIGQNISEDIQLEGQTSWKGQRTPSHVARDSNSPELPSQGPRSSVNFNLTDEQLKNDERASGKDKGRGPRSENNRRRKPTDSTFPVESTQNKRKPMRDEISARPGRSSDAGGSSFDADKRVAEIDRELERLYQEHQKAEERKRKESSIKRAVESSVIGAAATVAIGAMASQDDRSRSSEEAIPTRKSSLKKTREKDVSSSAETQQERIARMAAQRVRSTPSPVQHDDYSAFFVPTEIKEHLKEHNDKAEHRDEFGATVVEIAPGAPKPGSSHPFDPFNYRPFGLRSDDDPLLHPWPVPMLGLIEPTPPGSRVHSIRGDETPIIEPKSNEASDVIGEPLERKESKVTWGDPDTFVYEVVTPEYERSDYGPDSHFQGQRTADLPSPDEVVKEPFSITEDSQPRPAVGRAWTLDEQEAETLEKEVSVIDDRPHISRTWTVDDREAEEINQEQPQPRSKEGSQETTHHSTEHESTPQRAISPVNGDLEEQHKDSFPPETDEIRREKALYQSPFAETVSDPIITGINSPSVPPDTKPMTVPALEDVGDRSRTAPLEQEITSDTARPSKSDLRRRERSRSCGDAFEPPSPQEVSSEVRDDVSPRQPLHATDSDRNLANSVSSKTSALDMVLGASAVLAANQLIKDAAEHDHTSSPSRGEALSSRIEGSPTFSDANSGRQQKDSKGEYHSDPEEWERPREKSKGSKSSSKSDVGVKTSRKSKNRRSDDSADFEPLRRSRTDDDLYENEKSKRSSRHSIGDLVEDPATSRNRKDDERTSRGKHRRTSDGAQKADNASVVSNAPDGGTKESSGFFSNIFSSNKSDVSTSSKKSAKSSKSDSRADRERSEKSESRRKRRSRDKPEFDDVASAASEPARRSRHSPDRQTRSAEQNETSNDQTVDDGFVSAEETAGTPPQDMTEQESFLASRPEMPQPMVTDTPMDIDGVSGQMSETETSSPPDPISSVHAHGTISPTKNEHVAALPTTWMEDGHSGILPDEPATGVGEEERSLKESSSGPFPVPAASRRLSAIRTGDIPSSPLVASSPTAVPLHFRRPPISPTNPRFSMSSPVMSPSSPLTTPRTRQGRPKSTEFRSSKEFRPLYLVERQNYARAAPPELSEEYPSLPSSKTSSAHPSMEDLRAEAYLQNQPDSFTPSRISAESFREHGRRHSYSYWHDGEKRRESPDYLDSRSATPVPGEAQRARDQEKKPKPKYEFHSPSELLQDPAFFHDEALVDEEVVPHSPLPSVASTDVDQDYVSARSRSLSPARTRSQSRGRRSASTPRSTSVSWQDGIATAAAGALLGSALAVASHEVLEKLQEDSPADKTGSVRKLESINVAPESGSKAAHNAGIDNETASQQQTERESIQAITDMHRSTESQVPTKDILDTNAWRDVFTEIHKRRLDTDMITNASPESKAEDLGAQSLQRPADDERVTLSNLEEVVPAKSVDVFPTSFGEMVRDDTTSLEKVERPKEEAGEGDEASVPLPSGAAEPLDSVRGLEQQAEPVLDPHEVLEPQPEVYEAEAIQVDSESDKLQAARDKDDEDVQMAFNEASPSEAHMNADQADVEDSEIGEPKDVIVSDIRDVEALTSGTTESFEDALDAQPTESTPALDSDPSAHPEVEHHVDINEHLAVDQTELEQPLAEGVSSNISQSSRDPLEEAFKEAVQARGLVEGASVEAAYQAFQPEIPDVGGTQLSTIREEGETPSVSTQQASGILGTEADVGRSKKEKRNKKKAKKALALGNLVDSDSAPVDADQTSQPPLEKSQDVKTSEPTLSGEVNKELASAGEGPNPFGDDFEIKINESDIPPGDVKVGSDVPVTADTDSQTITLSSTPEDDSGGAYSKKMKKGKKGEKKPLQSYDCDETETGVDQTETREAEQVTDPVLQQSTPMSPLDEPAQPTLEGPGSLERSADSADTVQQDSGYAQETTSRSGKKKKSRKKMNAPSTIEQTGGQTPGEDPSTITILPYEQQPRTDQTAYVSSQTEEPNSTEQGVQEPEAIEESRAPSELLTAETIEVTSRKVTIDSSKPSSGSEVAGDQVPQTPGAADTLLSTFQEDGNSDEHQTLDVSTPADLVGAEKEPEAAGANLKPTNATALVHAVTPPDETQEEVKVAATSGEPLPELPSAEDEQVAKHLGRELGAIPTIGEGEQVHDEPGIPAPNPPSVVKEEVVKEPQAASIHEEGLASAKSPLDETSVKESMAHQDEDMWAFTSKKSRKDRKKKRASASDGLQNSGSGQEASLSDEIVTQPMVSEAGGDNKDTESPTEPASAGAPPPNDLALAEDEPRQDDGTFPVTKKSKKDKKKKRTSLLKSTESYSSAQDGETADSVANFGIPHEDSTTEAPTTQVAEIQLESQPAFGGEEPQDIGDGSGSKKKPKKSKGKKKRQSLFDGDVTGSADDVRTESGDQLPPTSPTPAAEQTAEQVEGSDKVPDLDEKIEDAHGLQPREGQASLDSEEQNTSAVEQQIATVLSTEPAENNDAPPQPAGNGTQSGTDPQPTLDVADEMPRTLASSFERLPDVAMQSAQNEAETKADDFSVSGAVADETSTPEPVGTSGSPGSQALENPPPEAASLSFPVNPTTETTTDLTDKLAAECTGEFAPESTTEPLAEKIFENPPESPIEPKIVSPTGPIPVSIDEPAVEPTQEPLPGLSLEPTSDPINQPTLQPISEPATEPSAEIGLQTYIGASTETTREPFSETDIEAPAEVSLDSSVGPVNDVGARGPTETAIESTPGQQLLSEDVVEEDLGLLSKRSKKEKKKKNKRQSTLVAETNQPSPLSDQTQAVSDEPEPMFDESTEPSITKSTLPEGETQGAAATTEDISEQSMAPTYVSAKKDKKKKKRESAQVADTPQVETVADLSNGMSIESESLAEPPPNDTAASESRLAIEPMTGDAIDATRPEGDAVTMEEDSEEVQQQKSETSWQDNLSSKSTKSKKDKKKKKRQSNIEPATPEPKFEASSEDASQSKADNIAKASAIGETETSETVETPKEEDVPSALGDQDEEWSLPSDKKKKNRKKGQKLISDEVSLPQAGEQVSVQNDPDVESNIENVEEEGNVNLPEKQPISEPIAQQDLAPAGADQMVSTPSMPGTTPSISLKGLGNQPQAAGYVEEPRKVQTVSEEDRTDVEKPLQEEPAGAEPVRGEAELVDGREERVPETAGSIAGTPEGVAMSNAAETTLTDQVFEQEDSSCKKAKKGKKKARQSAAEKAEEQEAVETPVEEADSSTTPQAEQPVTEKEMSTPKKSKSKNGRRNQRQLSWDDSNAEPTGVTTEIGSTNVEASDEATPPAMPDQGFEPEEWNVTKKKGKKKKRQLTFADFEALPTSVEASASPNPVIEGKQPEEKPLSSTLKDDAEDPPHADDLNEEQRSDDAVLDTGSRSVSGAGRQYETSTDATIFRRHAVVDGQDSGETAAQDFSAVAFGEIEADENKKIEPSHPIADASTTTPLENKRANISTESVAEAPASVQTDSAHVEGLSTSDAPMLTEGMQAQNSEGNLPETPILIQAGPPQPDEIAIPDETKALPADDLQSREAPPLERAESEAQEAPSAAQEEVVVENITEEVVPSRSKKNKKQRRSTYEEPVSEPRETGNVGPEVEAKESKLELPVVDSPEQDPAAEKSNDTVADEDIFASTKQVKKDKKKKRKTLSLEGDVNEPQPTIQNNLEKVEETTANNFQPDTEAMVTSIGTSSLEPDPERDIAEKATERAASQPLPVVEPTKDTLSGSAFPIPGAIQTSRPTADEMTAADAPLLHPESGSEMVEDTKLENTTAGIPHTEELDSVTPDLASAKSSRKEKRKSKKKTVLEEEPKTDDIEDLKAENGADTPRDDMPAEPSKSSTLTEVQPESEWGFSRKKSKKKGRGSKALTAADEFGTSGTVTPGSNDDFISAVQTPMQRTASPEIMDAVMAERNEVPTLETDSAEFFAPASSKKKSKRDKKRKSVLAWTGNEDQTAEAASGTSTPAPLTEPKISRADEIAGREALPTDLEKGHAESKLETPVPLTASPEMKTEDNMDSIATANQGPLPSQDYTNNASDTHESAVLFGEAGDTPGQRALGKSIDPISTSEQAASPTTKLEPVDDTLPREMEVDPAPPASNIGDGVLSEPANTASMILDSAKGMFGADPAYDQRMLSQDESGNFHVQDAHVELVTANTGVPDVTDHEQGVLETATITSEDRFTTSKKGQEDAVADAVITASKDGKDATGLEDPDFGISKDTSKRKKSKKDKKAKKKSGISEGLEDIVLPKMELDQTETREAEIPEVIHNEAREISDVPAHAQENTEDLSDVSATTRERRKRRKSPPAWSGEEPEDLPRDRALTPPPEHDDIMDTALGVAAGLGFGAGESESSRETPRKAPSPTRQPSAGWSFAKLDPVTKLAHAESNRDSGVQFESPNPSSGHFPSARDSGYVPSPTIQDGEFGTPREIHTDINLRPPRPQSPTSSTEDVSKNVTSRHQVDQSISLETPRRKPSPVESTSKDRSSVLFNSSPAMPSPINTDVRNRSPQAMASPLQRSPSIHGHHLSREELRQQKAKVPAHNEDSDQLGWNQISRSGVAPGNRSSFDSPTQANIMRPFSPGKTTLNAINEESHEASSQIHPFVNPPTNLTPRQPAETDSLATAGLVAAAGAAALAASVAISRDSPSPSAKSLGRSKSRTSSLRNLRSTSISPYDPANFASGSSQAPVNAQSAGKAAARDREMADVYDGYGSLPGSPRSPTRPPSIRQRQSMQQIRDLEAKLDQLASENRSLAEAKIATEQQLEQAHFERNRGENAEVAFNAQIQERDAEITRLKQEVASLIATHESLKREHEQSLSGLRQNYDEAQSQWQDSLKELETLRSRHNELSTGIESIVRHEIDTALGEKNAEIERLRGELEAARRKIRDLQSQILSRGADDVVVFHDEDYFDQACQKLCQQVQGWVLRFSKFSDLKLCRTTNEVRDEKIVDRFDNAILDGSDVDDYLADRVKRRDVFMSVVMTMIWEYVFTRYLFGMDRDQRQKLKQLEKNLGEVGPPSAVHQWRALTLTLLSKRESFKAQRESDTEAVAIEIFSTLSRFLPPPQHLENQIVGSLRNVMRTAVELSIEMRTQRAEYIMLPPLQPEYDTNGDLARKVYFNASLMNERSGETTSNEELEREHAVVRMVLFPLVVKKGDDNGVGDEEIVVCPAQVLIARPDKGKRVKSSTRYVSGGSDAKSLRAVSTHSLAMSGMEGHENMF
ncbi:hypothetical protein AYO20_09878 [Fonsecaea nubica]|uniref:Involucrin repeat protein n=1 Tax=Fonsecaea nubica TaxID=856822 RepID=A0A178CAR6_9EURO|nr:hypothetical protein AYO20_09878 [Fonsecaea nubica]OAL27070.1 hypothetical protein AYO20_09878 [Fonsecaea nubica]